MSAAIQNLLDQAGHLPGLLAAGVFAGNQSVASRAQEPSMTEAELGKVWRYLSEAMDVSHHHRMPATQMRWIFERVLVYCVKRIDGLQLGLILRRESTAQPGQEQLEALFNEFRKLRDK
jgi:hypothetical protein